MPKNRSVRLGFALFVLVTLLVIGRNVYRRSQEAALLNAIYGKDQEAAVSLLARGVFADNPARLAELCDQAIQHNEPTVARTLLQRGILPPHSDGQTVLLNAIGQCNEIIPLLLEKGVDVNARTGNGDTALSSCVQSRHLALARLLLEHGADANLPSQWNIPSRAGSRVDVVPLWTAASNGDIPMLTLLLEHGAHISPTPVRYGPLAAAAGNKSLAALRFLLEHGAGQEAKNNALICAVEQKRLDAIRLLLQSGAHPAMQSAPWLTALSQVHSQGDAAVLASLRPLGITATPDAAEKEARNEEGQTPLLAALAKSQVQAAQYWIAQGANVNAGDTDVGVRENTGRTPLLEAVDHCPYMVALLLAKHADPNGMTSFGRHSPQESGCGGQHSGCAAIARTRREPQSAPTAAAQPFIFCAQARADGDSNPAGTGRRKRGIGGRVACTSFHKRLVRVSATFGRERFDLQHPVFFVHITLADF